MTLSIELDPSTESALNARASEAGVPPTELVEALVKREFHPVKTAPPSEAEIDDWLAQLRALSSKVESLPDPNFTRETIYQDHD